MSFKCKRCGMSFLDRKPLYNRREELLRCPDCGISFGTNGGLGNSGSCKVWVTERGILPKPTTTQGGKV